MAVVVPILLAAGLSTRMGSPKALLRFGDRTCLQVITDAAREGGAAPPIVVVGPATDVEAHARGLNADGGVGAVVVNPRPEGGLVSSLRLAIPVLPPETDGFLIWPVDHPLTPACVVASLIARFVDDDGGHGPHAAPRREGRESTPRAVPRIVIPSFAFRRGHPVLMSRTLGGEILALPAGETARTITARHVDAIVYVNAPDDDVLADMDTPEDYQRCLARFHARAASRGPA